MKQAWLILMICVASCASITEPLEGRYINPPETLELRAHRSLRYTNGLTRGDGHWVPAFSNVVATTLQMQEWHGTMTGKASKVEWVPYATQDFFFCVSPDAGNFRTFRTQREAEDFSVFQDCRTTHCLVSGKVAKPGVYQVTANSTVKSLVQAAGGLAPHAWQTHMIIRRSGGEVIANLWRILENETNDVSVLPGDMIVVPHHPGLF